MGLAMSMGVIAGIMATTKTALLSKLSSGDSCKHNHTLTLAAEY